MIQAAKAFVAVTDEVWRLQRGNDAECRHFQEMAEGGHFGGTGGTRQGLYVLTPSGRLLAARNDLSAGTALETLQKGLAAWERTTEAERKLPDGWDLPRRRWEESYPTDGLVLRTFHADLGPEADRQRLNRDHVWFSKSEARSWLPAEPAVGATHELPRALVERLAQFHLVDNVRGQTLPFARDEVRAASIRTEVTARSEDSVDLRIQGSTRAETDDARHFQDSDWATDENFPRSVTAQLLGTARFNLRTNRFEAFDVVAVGERRGRTNLNGRTADQVGPAPIGWVFELAPDKAAERTPPAFVDVYGVSWITDPR